MMMSSDGGIYEYVVGGGTNPARALGGAWCLVRAFFRYLILGVCYSELCECRKVS